MVVDCFVWTDGAVLWCDFVKRSGAGTEKKPAPLLDTQRLGICVLTAVSRLIFDGTLAIGSDILSNYVSNRVLSRDVVNLILAWKSCLSRLYVQKVEKSGCGVSLRFICQNQDYGGLSGFTGLG